MDVRNANKKKVGEISDDRRVMVIRVKDAITKVIAQKDGTLKIINE